VILLAAAVLAVVFLLGIGLGLALEERPQSGKIRTSVRTFQPPDVPRTRTETATTVTVP
jgi:hypothetical protein